MAYAEEVDRLTTAAVRQLRADLVLVVTRLRATLAERLKKAHVDGQGRLVSDDWNAELAAKLEAEFSRLLEVAGYDGAVGRLRTTFAAVQKASGAWIEDRLSGSMAGAAERTITDLVDGTLQDLLLRKAEAADRLREAVVVALKTNAQIPDLLDTLAEEAGITLLQAIVEVDTQLMGLHRDATATESQAAGIDLYTYEGPDDGITRPFCAPMVGKITTLQDLDGMDPGPSQPRPVSRYLGGYRCRHSLAPISLEEAQAMVEEQGPRIIAPESPLARSILLKGKAGPAQREFSARVADLAGVRQSAPSKTRRTVRA